MLAPTFDILEDTDVFSDAAAGGVSGRVHRSKSMGKKGLGLRASAGPNHSNMLPLGGPQKLGGSGSSAAKSSSKSRRASARKAEVGGVSKTRAFGAVLATPNSNTAAARRGPRSKGTTKGGATKGGPVKAAKAGPTPMRAARAVLAPREKNITAIEVCHKGSGSRKPFDAEVAELMQTNKNAERLYRSACAAAMVGVPPLARGAGSYSAPLDDEAAFGIFEDDGEKEDGGRGHGAGGAPTDDDAGLLDLDGANLW